MKELIKVIAFDADDNFRRGLHGLRGFFMD